MRQILRTSSSALGVEQRDHPTKHRFIRACLQDLRITQSQTVKKSTSLVLCGSQQMKNRGLSILQGIIQDDIYFGRELTIFKISDSLSPTTARPLLQSTVYQESAIRPALELKGEEGVVQGVFESYPYLAEAFLTHQIRSLHRQQHLQPGEVPDIRECCEADPQSGSLLLCQD